MAELTQITRSDEAYVEGFMDACQGRTPWAPSFYRHDYYDGYADASIERDYDWRSLRANRLQKILPYVPLSA